MCSDDPNTIIIKTDAVNGISDLEMNGGVGSVVVEAGVTFPQVCVQVFFYLFSCRPNRMHLGRNGFRIVEQHWVIPLVCSWPLEWSISADVESTVNWNITLGWWFRAVCVMILRSFSGGAIAMGAHRSSLREDSQVSAAALAMDIINGKGDFTSCCRALPIKLHR